MSRLYFGTDGVRGPYGGPLVNEAFFARLAAAAGLWLRARPDFKRTQRDGSRAPESLQVLIGRDTRRSGPSLLQAAAAGLASAELEPNNLGVLPTPAVAWAVKRAGAALGVVITASHNPAGDNGIKFFTRGGLKLSDDDEAQVEALLPTGLDHSSAIPIPDLEESSLFFAKGWSIKYIEAMKRLLPGNALRGWRLVLDTASGATCFTSPEVFSGLGAEVTGLNVLSPREINDGVGSEHPEKMAELVRSLGARLGIAHDGDGDRCVLCDERGDILDGDEILTLLALHALREGYLAADTLVVTVQSNLGVDAALAAAGGRVVRTPVGDRYVAERMRAEGATLGGESSGHIICSDISPTGDGLVAALRVMEVMRATGRPLSELRRALVKFPQATATLTAREKPPLESLSALTAAIRTLEAELGTRGRVLVRWSGTETKLRFLVEGPDEKVVQAGLARLVAAAKAGLPLSGEG
jgi:phosphoglucosamine mutase